MSRWAHPRERLSITGRNDLENELARLLSGGALANGWLITGPEGAGKATLAYRIARALLASANIGYGPASLNVDPASPSAKLVASGAHPDLFVAEIDRDENSNPTASVIPVESIRDLIRFFNLSPAMGGWRVAIIDTADDLHPSAKNALLKVLEEPPARACVLLLSSAPGRLPATIRSRCRRINLDRLPESEIANLLIAEGITDNRQVAEIARASKGLPGYALRLASGAGAQQVAAVHEFIAASRVGLDAASIASQFVGKTNEEGFAVFVTHLLDWLADAARTAARSDRANFAYEVAMRREEIESLLRRGTALNLDRTAMLISIARTLRQIPAAE